MKKLLLSAICLYFISCSTPPPPNRQVKIPEDFLGIVHAGRTRNPIEDKLLEDMGCKWILNTFNWDRIEPEKDVFDFSRYDIYVEYAKGQGKKIIGLLGYGTDYSGKTKFYIPPEKMPSFLLYVEKTVLRYKGKVDVWCIWNEPNITFWHGTKDEFINLTKLTIKKIRETDPDAYIVGGAFWRSPAGFINKMHKEGVLNELDAFAFHPYSFNPSDCMNVYDKLLKIFSKINYSGPVWITEVGFPNAGINPTKVSLKKFPAYIVKTITGAAARGARALLWYEIFDRVDKGEISLNSEKYFGLINKDFSRKDGSWAYELCGRYLPGSRYVPELPQRENIPSNIVSFCFLDGITGNNTLILWNDKNNRQEIELNLPSSALVHDIYTGQNTPLQSGSSLDIVNKPLIITWRGTDIPRISKKQGK